MQACTALPPPEGMIWRYPGFPSLLVTYGVASDFFFSGHTAIAAWGGLEVGRLRFRGAAVLGVLIAVFEASTVIVLRAHYTMDVFTGLVVALLIAAHAEAWARPIDRGLTGLGRLGSSSSPEGVPGGASSHRNEKGSPDRAGEPQPIRGSGVANPGRVQSGLRGGLGFGLSLLDDLLLIPRRELLVLEEFHAEGALALGCGAEIVGVAEHLRERDLGGDDGVAGSALGPQDDTSLGRMAPVTGPWNSVGISTSTFMMGSRRTGSAFLNVSRKQSRAQISKAMVEESTSWYDPSSSRICTPMTSYPATGPLCSDSRKPFSTDGIYSEGIRPPVTLFSKTKGSGDWGSSGISLPTTWAYCPEPPVCFLCL